MSLNRFRVSLAGLFLLTMATACTTALPVKDSDALTGLYQARVAQLEAYESWEMEGRLAVNDGRDGGSGNFRWVREPGSTHMDFHGALGRGAWRLDADAHGARLEMANGNVTRSGTIDELAKTQLGWQVPVNALEWWVRGMEAPGGSPRREIDEQGVLLGLDQFGWNIEFDRYNDSDPVMMPYKITARKQDQTVKLAVRRWSLSTNVDGPE